MRELTKNVLFAVTVCVLLLIACGTQTVRADSEIESNDGFGSILNKILSSVDDTEFYNSTTYDLTPEDFVAMSNMTTAAVSDTTPVTSSTSPTGYLMLSVYQSGCSGTVGFQFAYPTGVCVSYGVYFSEYVSVSTSGNYLSITVTSFLGAGCSGVYVSASFTSYNGICQSPYVLTYQSSLPSLGVGVIAE
jgi:hypothetical protein